MADVGVRSSDVVVYELAAQIKLADEVIDGRIEEERAEKKARTHVIQGENHGNANRA